MVSKWIYDLPVSIAAMDRYADRPFAKAYVNAPERLPAPIGINCPYHPAWPMVWAVHMNQPDMGWCRRGQHLVALHD